PLRSVRLRARPGGRADRRLTTYGFSRDGDTITGETRLGRGDGGLVAVGRTTCGWSRRGRTTCGRTTRGPPASPTSSPVPRPGGVRPRKRVLVSAALGLPPGGWQVSALVWAGGGEGWIAGEVVTVGVPAVVLDGDGVWGVGEC